MLFDQNINFLKNEFPGISWDKMINYKSENSNSEVKLEASKAGFPTLVLEGEQKTQFLHSKYNPIEEAERVAEQFKEIDKGKHILFFGVGLGYLIKSVMKKYPDSNFSIYEPNLEVFYNFLSQISLNDTPFERLSNIFIENYFENEDVHRYFFFRTLSNNTSFVYLPIYKQVFNKEFTKFSKEFIQSIKSKGFDIRTRFAFERQWMENYVKNFKYILSTNNILHTDKNFFKGKPAILVSAGPSLEEEIENLKYIKANKLAYIFSVGSAIRALKNNGINPDAICAVDGGALNYELYGSLISDENNNIPLIFGSTFYNKVVDDYNANKFHMFLNTDSIAEYYLRYRDDTIDKVGVAPSVAITTLELLYKLGFGLIALVGQNFAYKNNNYYSNSIEGYEVRSTNMNNKDRQEAFEVDNVTGGIVLSSPSLNIMRKQMELLIERSGMTNIINTTSGGAKIKGTFYEPLADVIKNRLGNAVMEDEWTSRKIRAYDKDYLIEQHEFIKEARIKFDKALNEFSSLVDKLSEVNKYKKEKTINSLLDDFGRMFSKLIRNKLYEVYIAKISSVEQDILLRNLEIIRTETDLVSKANKVGELFKSFVESCKIYLEFTDKLLDEMDITINDFMKTTNSDI